MRAAQRSIQLVTIPIFETSAQEPAQMLNRIRQAARFNAFRDRCINEGVIDRSKIKSIHEGETIASPKGAWVLNFVTLEMLSSIQRTDPENYESLRSQAAANNFYA
jgi:hypothetical protein